MSHILSSSAVLAVACWRGEVGDGSVRSTARRPRSYPALVTINGSGIEESWSRVYGQAEAPTKLCVELLSLHSLTIVVNSLNPKI